MQQLKNVINVFFLFNAYMQSVSQISTNSPLASLIPVSWIIGMGMLFDLIADLRRWMNDRQVNNYPVR